MYLHHPETEQSWLKMGSVGPELPIYPTRVPDLHLADLESEGIMEQRSAPIIVDTAEELLEG